MESPKLRLMCSYGGHIIPRPNNKSLSYTGGETRIVSIDRRSSFSSLISHLSRTLLNNRPFHLKYQIPNEDLDSLISVTTDEDLDNMIDEHDRISSPGRIRLFLFPISKVESFDLKSDSWFCDALKGTRISEELVRSGSRVAGVGAESFVLETSSSFGSTGSSFSMANSPPVVSGESCGLGLLDRNVRVPSSASIASDISAGGGSSPPKDGSSPSKAGLSPPKDGLSPPKAGQLQEQPLIQVSPEVSLIHTKSETSPETSVGVQTQNTVVHVLGYPLTQQPKEKQLQQEPQLIQGGMQYLPQYAINQMPISSYYPVYQMPLQQQQPVLYQTNQQYPIYLVPVRPTQYHNVPMQCNVVDSSYSSSCGLQLHTPTATNTSNVAHNEIFRAQTAAEATTNVYLNIPSKPVTPDSAASATQCNEFDEDIVYSQIFKTQPSAPVPVLSSQYRPITNGVPVMLSESSVQLQQSHAKEQAALHPI